MSYINKIKNIVGRFSRLQFTPEKEWQRVESEAKTSKNIAQEFLFGFLAICGVIAFIGYSWNFGIWVGIRGMVATIATLFLTALSVSHIFYRMRDNIPESTKNDAYKLIFYSSMSYALFYSIGTIFGASVVGNICELAQYLFIWSIWKGITPITKVNHNHKIVNTIAIFLIFTFIGYILDIAFTMILSIPVANI